MSYSKLIDREKVALLAVASALSVDPEWLYQLIDFESGWNPAAKNPYSTARGLIQFTDTTARRLLGYSDADQIVENFPDRVSQLQGPVYKYLAQYAPFPSQQSLAMAVYYPAYRSVPADTAFPADTLKNNPGIVTVNDYLKKVFPFNVMPIAIIGGMAIAFFLFYKLS